MAQYYEYIRENGIVRPDTSVVQEDVRDEWRRAFKNQDLSVEESTPQGQFIQEQTRGRIFALESCAQSANQLNPELAIGNGLDALAAAFLIKRIEATSTRVLCECGGIPGTVIPIGAQVRDSRNVVFAAQGNITIAENGIGQGYFVALQTGAIAVEAGAINRIITNVIGWESIRNPANGILGRDRESDFALRRRIYGSRWSGTALPGDVQSALNGISGISGHYFYNNGRGEPVVVEGITIDKHSVLVIVNGDADQEVAEALFRKVSAGCGYTAIPDQSVVVNVIDGAYSVTYPITFNKPLQSPIVVEIMVANINFTGADIVSDVQNTLVNWSLGNVDGYDAIQIGQNISPFAISNALSQIMTSIQVVDVKIAREGSTPTTATIDYPINEIASFQPQNISVTVIAQ